MTVISLSTTAEV